MYVYIYVYMYIALVIRREGAVRRGRGRRDLDGRGGRTCFAKVNSPTNPST